MHTAQEVYWETYLADCKERAAFPQVGKQNAEREALPQEITFAFDQPLTTGLFALAADHHVTFHTMFVCIWGILLQRYNNTDDVVFGITGSSAAWLPRGVDAADGLAAPVIPVRVQAHEKQPFSVLLQQVERRLIEAQRYAFSRLEEMYTRVRQSTDLIDHILDFGTSGPGDQEATRRPEIAGVSHDLPSDLQVFVRIADENRVVVLIRYDGQQRDSAFIERVGWHIETIASQVVATPAIALEDLSILSPHERVQILDDFNALKRFPRPHAPVHQLFEEQAQRTPYHQAVIAGESHLTYIALQKKSSQLAAYLRQQGVRPEMIVPILVERSVEMIVGILGILKTGGAYLPIEPQTPAERIGYMLEESGAWIILTHSGLPEGVAFRGTVVHLADERLYQGSASEAPMVFDWHHLAYVIYTSGSTGRPKGVMVEHGALADLCCWYRENYGITETSRVFLMIPFTFDASVKNIITPLLSGGCLVLAPPRQYNSLEILRCIEQEKVTLINCVPSAIYQIEQLAARRGYRPLSSLQSLALGGESMNLSRLRDWLGGEDCATILSNLYGPTEGTDLAVGCEIEKALIRAGGAPPLGKPIVHTKVYVLDAYGNPQPVGVIGEVCLSGDGLARGYLHNPELTAEKFVSNPFSPAQRMYKTGDLARWRFDGTLEFLGRSDYQVKIRGFRVEIEEIEQSLLDHDGISEVAVVDEDDGHGNKRLCAYILADTELEDTALKAYLARTLPAYMIPSQYVRVASMPLTPHGKIDRNNLQKLRG